MAKRFENGRGTGGLEKSNTKRVLRTERLLSVLRETFCASEEEKWPTVTHRKNTEMPDRWIDGVPAGRKVIFVLWAEPMVSFRKEISGLSEINDPSPD
jgi:hypothetical protein